MFIHLCTLVLFCLINIVRSQEACDRRGWRSHRNFYLLPKEDECGKVKVNPETSPRILNGKVAAPGSLPWMAYVSIVYSGKYEKACGGSVINSKYILTVAHCFRDLKNTNTKVYLGAHNRNKLFDRTVENYNVVKYIIHPNYDKNATKKNDIALLRLDRSVNTKSPYINYVCLPLSCELSEKDFYGYNLTVSGWGSIFYGQAANNLQRVVLKGQDCKYAYSMNGKTYTHDWSDICAGSGDFMTCRGDSGGPLTYKTETDGRFVQVGVAKLGPNVNCSVVINDNVMSIFTRVAEYLGWILNTIEP